jgi:hypothetical protein
LEKLGVIGLNEDFPFPSFFLTYSGTITV